ncbi:hypothetical protein KDL44_12820 [bacterium]|nr:hypothetical protein [bacterium]
MKQLNRFAISLMIVIFAALAASCGGSNIGIEQPAGNDQDQGSQQQLEEQINLDDLPLLPFDGEEEQQIVLEAKGASWVSSPDHLTPVLHHNAGVDPGDPACYLLKGRKPVFTHVPKGPDFAYALYQIPVGALEPDLLSMKVEAQVGAAGEVYFGAIANYTAMNWKFYGPEGAAPTWGVDMTTAGYDFTSPAGNLYVLLLVPAAQSLHVTDIVLDYKDRDKPIDPDPTVWNVWGQAFEDYATGMGHGGYQVSFEDLNTGVIYTTMTDPAGNWGMNLASGHYKFGVDSNEMLLDVSGPVSMIDYIYNTAGFGIKMDLDNMGQMVYVDSNAAYHGSVVPMPLITANNF